VTISYVVRSLRVKVAVNINYKLPLSSPSGNYTLNMYFLLEAKIAQVSTHSANTAENPPTVTETASLLGQSKLFMLCMFSLQIEQKLLLKISINADNSTFVPKLAYMNATLTLG